MNNSFLVDENGFYGEFGGAYVPEILYATVENLRREYLPIIDSEDFRKEYALMYCLTFVTYRFIRCA